MTKKEKISEYWKEHEKEILINITGIIASGLLGAYVAKRLFQKKYPHSTTIYSSSKEYIDAIKKAMNWGACVQTDGAYIAYAQENIQIVDSIILERIDKTKLK